MPVHVDSEEVTLLAEQTEGYSGADLENLCREAALICLRHDIKNTEVCTSAASFFFLSLDTVFVLSVSDFHLSNLLDQNGAFGGSQTSIKALFARI